jgi:hypothetical protein
MDVVPFTTGIVVVNAVVDTDVVLNDDVVPSIIGAVVVSSVVLETIVVEETPDCNLVIDIFEVDKDKVTIIAIITKSNTIKIL